jgi:SAM-dependent methyltransferase
MTAKFYASYVEHGMINSEAPNSAISKYFDVAFKSGDKVLDVGSGSGRDVALLLKKGVDAYGIEPNASMRTYSLQKHPELATRVQFGLLPITRVPFGGSFDGVLCSAVLMHIHQDYLVESWRSILKVLKPNGKVLFSLPSMRPSLLKDGRDEDGRLFKNYFPDIAGFSFSSLGFKKIDLGAEATSDYPDITWTIYLFEVVAASR